MAAPRLLVSEDVVACVGCGADDGLCGKSPRGRTLNEGRKKEEKVLDMFNTFTAVQTGAVSSVYMYGAGVV